jgi:hypothetical protein
MPEQTGLKRARIDLQVGSNATGEYVRAEMEYLRIVSARMRSR